MPLSQPPIQDKTSNPLGLFPQTWVKWFTSIVRLTSVLRDDGTIEPITLQDSSAPNNSIYYSSDQSKLVYKDSGGTVNDLY